MGSLMSGSGSNDGGEGEEEKGDINVSKLLTSMFSTIGSNDLASLKQYLESTTLLINGQEVKPTEEDVDKCVGYLTAMGSLVCDKTVRDTVRKYLKGEIDINLKTEELQEQIEENESTIAENEEEIKDTLTKVVLSQQNRIKVQENEIADLKSQRRDIDG